jgi:uncharacterized membrane protein YgcG
MMRLAWMGLLILWVAIVDAANFTIEDYRVAIAIDKDRSFEVEERLQVRFSIPQRGIIRRIPTTVGGRSVDLRLISVMAGDASTLRQERYHERRERSTWSLRIGDPNRTHRGLRNYILRYRVQGALTNLSAGQGLGDRTEFLWNVIGHEWTTRIERATLAIEFPSPSGPTRARILVGPRGSRQGVEVGSDRKLIGNVDLAWAKIAGTSLEASVLRALGPGEGITVALALPKGTVDERDQIIPTSTSVDPEEVISKFMGSQQNPLGIFVPLVAPVLAWLAFKKRFPPKLGPLVTRFEPPKSIDAVDSGTLIDGKFDSRDLVAGIITLAQKGALRLVKSSNRDIELHLSSSIPNGVTRFERRLYYDLQSFGDVVRSGDLKGQFGAKFRQLSAIETEDLSQRGLLSTSNSFGQGALGCALTLSLVVLSICACAGFGAFALIGLFVGFIALAVILSKRMPHSETGFEIRHHLLGLREFIMRANADYLRAMTDKMPDQALFEKLLPYAVAFHAVPQWVHAFDGIHLDPPAWFDDPTFNTTSWVLLGPELQTFSDDWGRDLSYVASSNSWSSGDSGFGGGWSGGGFDGGSSSGDGGGGGGGDSW